MTGERWRQIENIFVQAVEYPLSERQMFLDRVCQGVVWVWCLDDIFLHREPILRGVEPTSWAWLAGQRGPERSGESGCQVMEQWPSRAHVVADGGTGLETGVQ